MADLVGSEDAKESEGKRPACGELFGMAYDPGKREEVRVDRKGRSATMEVEHQHRAGAERGKDTQAEQANRYADALQRREVIRRHGLQWCSVADRTGDLYGRLTHAAVLASGDTRRRQCTEMESLRQYFIVRGFVFRAVEKMEFFTGFEANGFAGGDADFSAGAWIASDPRFPRADIEDAEATQFDTLAIGERALESLEYGIDSSFGLIALQAGALNHLVNDVLLYQGFPPSGEVSVLRLILEIFDPIVNAVRLP
jgi:hypothetical protein